jgi:hypothetical protein
VVRPKSDGTINEPVGARTTAIESKSGCSVDTRAKRSRAAVDAGANFTDARPNDTGPASTDSGDSVTVRASCRDAVTA